MSLPPTREADLMIVTALAFRVLSVAVGLANAAPRAELHHAPKVLTGGLPNEAVEDPLGPAARDALRSQAVGEDAWVAPALGERFGAGGASLFESGRPSWQQADDRAEPYDGDDSFHGSFSLNPLSDLMRSGPGPQASVRWGSNLARGGGRNPFRDPRRPGGGDSRRAPGAQWSDALPVKQRRAALQPRRGSGRHGRLRRDPRKDRPRLARALGPHGALTHTGVRLSARPGGLRPAIRFKTEAAS